MLTAFPLVTEKAKLRGKALTVEISSPKLTLFRLVPRL
jgi:hypothetical protein